MCPIPVSKGTLNVLITFLDRRWHLYHQSSIFQLHGLGRTSLNLQTIVPAKIYEGFPTYVFLGLGWLVFPLQQKFFPYPSGFAGDQCFNRVHTDGFGDHHGHLALPYPDWSSLFPWCTNYLRNESFPPYELDLHSHGLNFTFASSMNRSMTTYTVIFFL